MLLRTLLYSNLNSATLYVWAAIAVSHCFLQLDGEVLYAFLLEIIYDIVQTPLTELEVLGRRTI